MLTQPETVPCPPVEPTKLTLELAIEPGYLRDLVFADNAKRVLQMVDDKVSWSALEYRLRVTEEGVTLVIEEAGKAEEKWDDCALCEDKAKCLAEKENGANSQEPEATHEPKQEDSASEALFGFMGWLTTRPVASGPFSSVYDAAPAGDLVAEYCRKQGYAEPRDDWGHAKG